MSDERVTISETTRALTNWAEIDLLQPTFDVDANAVQVGSIYRPYAIAKKEKRPCAIRQCHTPHFNGVIVRLGDGALCCIGQRCGEKHFPDWKRVATDFAIRKRAEIALLQFEDLKKNLALWQDRLSSYATRLNYFDAALESMEHRVHRHVIDSLYRRAEKNDATISTPAALTEEEKEFARTTGQNPRTRDIIVGVLSGLRVFRAGFQPRRIADGLRKLFRDIDSIANAHSLAFNRIAKDSADVDARFVRLETGLADSGLFFTNENLALLTKLPMAKETGLRKISIATDGTINVG
jgi:hypothetical protein